MLEKDVYQEFCRMQNAQGLESISESSFAQIRESCRDAAMACGVPVSEVWYSVLMTLLSQIEIKLPKKREV